LINRRVRSVLIIIPVIIFFSSIIPKESGAIRMRNVLVLHSYHIGLSWTERIISGVEKSVARLRAGGMKVHVDYEYMDTKRFVSPDHYQNLFKIYKEKSKKLSYDVIIAVDDNALNFMLKYRDELYGKVPVVFCGINFFRDSMLKGKELYTGVLEAFDVNSTIDLALKLHPDTKNFYVIGDSSTSGKQNVLYVESAIKPYEKKGYRFVFLTDGDIEKAHSTLLKLGKGNIVLALLFNRDSRGNFYTYEESMEQYLRNVKAPVYSFWDFYIGHGITGGMIISGEAQGEEAANMAGLILMGERIGDIPILRESPNRFMFDYPYLVKNGIDPRKLPHESIIFNKPVTYFERLWEYRMVIMIVLIIIFSLIAVIVTLSVNIIKRKKLQNELIITNKSFERFVPHEFLENLQRENILDVELGDNIQKDMTVFFTDIRSFTTLSEKMTPEENFRFLNSYLKIVSPIIRSHSGFIDKYIGDAIMAIFPVKSEDAVRASIEMHHKVIDYNLERGRAGYDPINIGIGMHFGSLMMGTIGEEERMEGTVISDAVNLASRLEGLTKHLGAKVIISEDTLKNIGSNSVKYNVRYLGKVVVKGKSEPVNIYELIDGNNASVSELKLKSKKLFEKGVNFYQAADFFRAADSFEKVLKINSSDIAAEFYLNECRRDKDKTDGTNWQGYLNIDMK